MDVEDENISTLMAMGFPDIGEIKRALRLAKNDLNEAVAILTNDQSVSSYGPVADLNIDVDMKDVAGLSKGSSEEASVAEVKFTFAIILFVSLKLSFITSRVEQMAFLKPTCMNWSQGCLPINGLYPIRKMKVYTNASQLPQS